MVPTEGLPRTTQGEGKGINKCLLDSVNLPEPRRQNESPRCSRRRKKKKDYLQRTRTKSTSDSSIECHVGGEKKEQDIQDFKGKLF